jgi:hypothetical protein
MSVGDPLGGLADARDGMDFALHSDDIVVGAAGDVPEAEVST